MAFPVIGAVAMRAVPYVARLLGPRASGFLGNAFKKGAHRVTGNVAGNTGASAAFGGTALGDGTATYNGMGRIVNDRGLLDRVTRVRLDLPKPHAFCTPHNPRGLNMEPS